MLGQRVRAERYGGAGDYLGEPRAVHRAAGDRKRRSNAAATRGRAPASGKRRATAASTGQRCGYGPEPMNDASQAILQARPRGRHVAVTIHRLRKETHERNAGLSVAVALPSIRGVECAAEPGQFDDAFLGNRVNMPEDRGAIPE